MTKRDGYWLWKCKKCHFAEVLPKPSNEAIVEYYRLSYSSKHYRKTINVGQLVKEKKFEWLMRQVQKKTNVSRLSEISILDVGCGDGAFLKIARKRGCRDFLGLEIADEAASIVAKSLGEDNVFAGTLEAYAEISNRKYAVITMFDLIEHVKELDCFMKAVDKLLEKNGYILLTTPNWRSVYSLFLGSMWPYFIPVEHLCFFSPKAIKHFSAKYGYKTVLTRRAIKYVSLRYFVEVANVLSPPMATFASLILNIMPSYLKDAPFPVYFGEIFAILRKCTSC